MDVSWDNIKNDLSNRIKEEDWPNDKFGAKIKLKKFDYHTKYSYTQNTKWHDLTGDLDATGLAQNYLPQIYLIGQDLRNEKNSKRWGGVLYRVLSENERIKDSKRAIIQYIFIWSKQRLPLTFWNIILPLSIFILLSLYINTDLTYDSLIFPDFIPLESIVDRTTKIRLIFILCVSYVLIGVYHLFKKTMWEGNVSIRSLFFFIGFLFLLLQWWYDFSSFTRYSLPISSPFLSHSEILIHFDYPTLITILLTLFLFILILFFRIIEFLDLDKILLNPIMRKIAGTHEMDYVPIFVYLKTSSNGTNILENPEVEMLYDRLHYQVHYEYKSPKDGVFTINGLWHSCEFKTLTNWSRNRKYWKIFGILPFMVSLVGLIIALILGIDLLWAAISWLPIPLGMDVFFHRLVYPFIISISFFYYVTDKTTDLLDQDDSKNLAQRSHFLSPVKLLHMWNFSETKAQFTIKHKLQFPFEYKSVNGEEAWITFYNDQQEKEEVSGIFSFTGLKYLIEKIFRKNRIIESKTNVGQKLMAAGRFEEAHNVVQQIAQLSSSKEVLVLQKSIEEELNLND